MPRVVAFLAIVLVLMPACTLASPPTEEEAASPTVQESLRTRADYVLAKLAAGNADSVVSLLHYPPSYSKKELSAEMADIQDGLMFILEKLGTPQGFKAFSGQKLWYELALSAGDVSYWDSLSPMNTVEFMYAGKFSRFGAGALSVSFFETKSGMDLRTVIFRLDPSVPKARQTLIDIYVELVRRKAKATGEPVPENLRELISASVPDLSATETHPHSQPSK